MAIQGGRLPPEYVFAFVDDPAIDWLASVRKMDPQSDGVSLSQLTPEQLSERGAALYRQVRATARLPLIRIAGEVLTVARCRPLTHGELREIRERYRETQTVEVEQDDGSKAPVEVVADLDGYTRDMCKLAVVGVDGLLTAYESIDDLLPAQIMELGLNIARVNSLPAETRDF